jgi:hypothetical protein
MLAECSCHATGHHREPSRGRGKSSLSSALSKTLRLLLVAIAIVSRARVDLLRCCGLRAFGAGHVWLLACPADLPTGRARGCISGGGLFFAVHCVLMPAINVPLGAPRGLGSGCTRWERDAQRSVTPRHGRDRLPPPSAHAGCAEAHAASRRRGTRLAQRWPCSRSTV